MRKTRIPVATRDVARATPDAGRAPDLPSPWLEKCLKLSNPQNRQLTTVLDG